MSERREVHGIVGEDPALREAIGRAQRVAPTRVAVLITGESGTGKELMARLLHDEGRALGASFVAVNCGTLPRELADSELFGHERGAFTGADRRKAGWFEQAHGGTLVLDEVGELPLELQPKLLRVLDTGRVRRVGGTGEVAVQVRVVAMTLRDLRREVERGAFRVDLFHRLAGLEITLPPLRERRADIPLLVRHFLAEIAAEDRAADPAPHLPRAVAPDALDRLCGYPWPGNIRELRNVLRRAAILCPHVIDGAALELAGTAYAGGGTAAPPTGPRLADAALPSRWASPPDTGPPPGDGEGERLSLVGRTFEQIERHVFAWALRRHGGSRRRAAAALALPRSTFCDKVKRYGLGGPGDRAAAAGRPASGDMNGP